jgi:hypothetical protein
MASEAQIAKLALQHLGDRYDITSLDEASPEAEQVNLIFEDVRDAMLRSHPWKFAVKQTSPSTLVGTVPNQWDYMFVYPSDALKVLNIVNPFGRAEKPIKFDVMLNSTGTKVLVCDLEEPEFRYISKVTDTGMFDPAFVIAFAYRLAENLAIPLTGDTALRDRMRALADAETSAAMRENANEGVEEEIFRDPDWITARA